MLIAAFDIGTSDVKGVLTDLNGSILGSHLEPIETIYSGEYKEQRPQDWYDAFCKISRQFQLEAEEPIGAVILSGQMQDVIPVKKNGEAVGNAILYSDGRAEEEAQELSARTENAYLEYITGNHFDGSLSVPKICWLKKHAPDIFDQAEAFLISAKDYVLLRLTGKTVGDVVACSTAGGMDLVHRRWDEKLLNSAGIAPEKFPKLYYPHELVSAVTETAANETGLSRETKVYAGTGDIGATTLASGISRPGEYNINLGTSGWVATVSRKILGAEGGVFNLSFLEKDLYINVVPFLNAANVHQWAARLFSDDEKADYARIDDILSRSEPGSHGVFFLPYLNGERFPVMDTKVKGSFLGITAQTGKEDLVRSTLEGVAFSIRQGIEKIGVPAQKVSVIGGGARVKLWNQILADVLGQKVTVYGDSDILPALALASCVQVGEGICADYSEFTASLQTRGGAIVYEPDRKNRELYEKVYREYLRVYPAVSPFYQGLCS